jgi:hypothetical protein
MATYIGHVNLLFRYVLASLLGVPLGLGYIVPGLGRKTNALFIALLVFSVGVPEGLFWLTYRGHLAASKSQVDSVERLVEAAGQPDLPVVISDGLEFLPLIHYADQF